ncbi:hypothetical protein [Sphingomonas sp. Ag1]|uniref:hypothetical protein n=1 Tax=Sphingomonas sp. Ag1 TaxID=1642949 RepID=UPI0006224AD3|nr:hypothetical protein [Sphingomonas sp. Ag1]KKI19598.1 hypothetical protein XM50_08900 [Sphingomonas sp. Ag1]
MIDEILKLTPAEALSATVPHDRSVFPAHAGVTSVFADDVWDLAATELGSRSANQLTIDFTFISHNKPAWKLAAKELAFYRLNTKLSSTVDKIQPYTCAREQTRLKRFIRWLDRHYPDMTSPAGLTQTIVHAYRKWLEKHDADQAIETLGGGNRRSGVKASVETVWAYLSPIKSMDLYREFLTEPLNFSPYGGQLTAKFVGVDTKKGNNKTPVISDDVLHPLITVGLRYVDHYWRDVKAMTEDRLQIWARYHSDGWSKFDGWTARISDCPDTARPWREPLGSAGRHPNHEFRDEMGHFIAACSTIALYLSGMRPREWCGLRVGCLRKVLDPLTGKVVRWRVRGLPAKKKKKKNRTEPVEWVVPEPVARAIQMLEEVLAPFRERLGTDLLVLNFDAFQRETTTRPGAKAGMDERSLGNRLKALLQACRDRYGFEIKSGIAPAQFRRTLARHIARQPFGILAGKLQYHHVETAIFEGYAGSEDDGFRLEVADEKLLANIDLLEEMREDARNGCLLGPGAASLVREYDAALLASTSDVMIDRSPNEAALGAAMKSLAKRVHVGAINFCIWGTAKALCLTEEEAARKDAQPNINMCSPDKCGNSTIGSCHIPRWQGLLDDVNALAATARSGPQKVSLRKQAERYQRVLMGGTGNGHA